MYIDYDGKRYTVLRAVPRSYVEHESACLALKYHGMVILYNLDEVLYCKPILDAEFRDRDDYHGVLQPVPSDENISGNAPLE